MSLDLRKETTDTVLRVVLRSQSLVYERILHSLCVSTHVNKISLIIRYNRQACICAYLSVGSARIVSLTLLVLYDVVGAFS